MKFRCMPRLIVLFMVSIAAPALAEIYQWIDSAGVHHFTDNPDTIPAHYLNRTKTLTSGQPDQRGAPSPGAAESAPPLQPSVDRGSSLPGEGATATRLAERAKLETELQHLLDGLPGKRTELGNLRRKWIGLKGRTPTPKEIAEFEKKKAKGPVSFADNPYYNKNPLGAPGRAREAYYRKLADVKKDEERIAEIRNALQSMVP